mgnify:CR=1 FL=1
MDKETKKVLDGLIKSIKKIMQEKGINQSQLAKLMGTDRTYLSRILQGKVNPTLETIAIIANRLGTRCLVRWLTLCLYVFVQRIILRRLTVDKQRVDQIFNHIINNSSIAKKAKETLLTELAKYDTCIHCGKPSTTYVVWSKNEEVQDVQPLCNTCDLNEIAALEEDVEGEE